MKRSITLLLLLFQFISYSQTSEDQLGAWYMYFWNHDFKSSKFGVQGDFQYRDYEIAGDFQQFIARAGLTYAPNANIKFVGGYSYFSSGTFGESKDTSSEHRIYEDINLPHKISKRFLVNHRIRFEQRWVENQDFRSRYRYMIGLTIPLGKIENDADKFYLVFSNEVFINGERQIGNGRTVAYFDRNWLAGSVGYKLRKNMTLQLGIMRETTNTVSKNQLLISLHHSF